MTLNRLRIPTGVLLAALLLSLAGPARAAVWQYSIPVGKDPLRRAYLWVPPDCRKLRGILIGVQNMLEEPMFEDPQVRQALAASGMGIVWISPADDLEDRENRFKQFQPPAEVARSVQEILSELATESGYHELEQAPLLVTGHSAATPFVWGMATAFRSRIIAVLPYKGWIPGPLPAGIPVLHVGSEWAEVGGEKWGHTYLRERDQLEKIRALGPDRLVGDFVDIGAGHFDWSPEAARVIAMFLRKAAEYRLPAPAAAGVSPALRPIDPASGCLIEAAQLGSPDARLISAAFVKVEPSRTLWYFDREMARAVNDYMAARLRKKPQVIDFLEGGKPAPLDRGGIAELHPQLLEDGVTFRVRAVPLDRSPVPGLFGGGSVGHASGPIRFRASTGALRQTGPDTFRVWMHRGSAVRQGPPWEPWVLAFRPGDDEYRAADRPGHPWLPTVNHDGKPQRIDFPPIPNQRVGIKSLRLRATSDAGLPVQFYVISGPA